MRRAPILDRKFIWIPPDDDSTEFRKRQQKRVREAAAAAAQKVIPIQRTKGQA